MRYFISQYLKTTVIKDYMNKLYPREQEILEFIASNLEDTRKKGEVGFLGCNTFLADHFNLKKKHIAKILSILTSSGYIKIYYDSYTNSRIILPLYTNKEGSSTPHPS